MSNELSPSKKIGLSAVSGLRCAAVRTGVKPSCDLDLAVVVADEPMTAAGVFTKNTMAAAPVDFTRRRLEEDPTIRSIVINAGNANALTGQMGALHAQQMVTTLEETCGGPGIVMSTGVIGVQLPIGRVCDGIRVASQQLSSAFEPDLQLAIRTTDTCNKQASISFEAHGQTFDFGGVAKGSGMIHPNMATMLAIIATDAPISPTCLREGLRDVADKSFNRISVDGDTSTNDTVIALSRPPRPGCEYLTGEALQKALTAMNHLCRELALQIVRDGEGATRVMEINVEGTDSNDEAEIIAGAIARSSLVKTAIGGGDPNWGRILSAVGNAGLPISPAAVSLRLGDDEVVHSGELLAVDSEQLAVTFSKPEFRITVVVGEGAGSTRHFTTDLTHEYVSINAEYTT